MYRWETRPRERVFRKRTIGFSMFFDNLHLPGDRIFSVLSAASVRLCAAAHWHGRIRTARFHVTVGL
jgi:hypothetical protein